jgi:hypothetical protein
MSNKQLYTGVVIGAGLTLAVCYIFYIENEKRKLEADNDLLRRKLKELPLQRGKVINLDSVPREFRHAFIKEIQGHSFPAAISYKESRERISHLKTVIEDRDGYKLFYKDGVPFRRESDLHILYDLCSYKTFSDINKEVNNGRGPVDFKSSVGRFDQTIIEFKLASNSQLKRNLIRQTEIYAQANQKPAKIICILFMTEKEKVRLNTIISELNLVDKDHIILIDARNDNKTSASVA